jgi:hypothetical protein
MVKMLPGYPLKCSTKIDSGVGLHVRYTMDSGHQKLRDFIETLTEKECDELYKMLKTLLEEEDEKEEHIYSTVEDMKVNELTGTYYQTYGGGPEGGYYKTKERWYHLHRTWHQPWTVTLCQDMQVLYDMGTIIRAIAIFPAGPPEPLDEDDYEVMPPA